MKSIFRYMFYVFGLVRSDRGGTSILLYHRATGDTSLELDIHPRVLEEQLKMMLELGEVISYESALQPPETSNKKWRFVLTFDDGYKDFYSNVLPLLKKYAVPATLFVSTEYIDNPTCVPISNKNIEELEQLVPLTWDELRALREESLVSIAAHTHSHPELTQLGNAEIIEELHLSHKRFEEELGFIPEHFAYPRGIWNKHVRDIVKPFYKSATIVGGDLVDYLSFDSHAVPRIGVRQSDGLKWFMQRCKNQLWLEEKAIYLVKKLIRSLRKS